MTDMSDPDNEMTRYLCIGCPLGCRLELEETSEHEIVEVRGFSCKKGEEFAIQEHTDPRRMVTTTIPLTGGTVHRLPVRTTGSVPKDVVIRLCDELRGVTAVSPVAMGEVVVRDALGTGVDVIASRDVPVADGGPG